MPVIPKKHLLGPPPPSDEELSGKINAVLMAAKARKDTIARLDLGLTAESGRGGGPLAERALAMLSDADYESWLEPRSYHILINLRW